MYFLHFVLLTQTRVHMILATCNLWYDWCLAGGGSCMPVHIETYYPEGRQACGLSLLLVLLLRRSASRSHDTEDDRICVRFIGSLCRYLTHISRSDLPAMTSCTLIENGVMLSGFCNAVLSVRLLILSNIKSQ